jgi:hypothetical protein
MAQLPDTAALAQRPLSFGVYDEGAGVLSLYLSPLRAELLVEVVGQAAPASSAVCLSEVPQELIWLERGLGVDELGRLPSSLLAHPQSALPEGARAAAVFTEADHAVVLSREPPLLAACLGVLVEEALPDRSSELPGQALLDLVVPMAAHEFCEIHFDGRRRYRLLVLDTRDSQQSGKVVAESRWVARGSGGRWRTGWSW